MPLHLLPSDTPIFDWAGSNGSATALQTALSYAALFGGGLCADFSHLVWNDIADKVNTVLTGAGLVWDAEYLDLESTKMTGELRNRHLTEQRFNSVRHNINRCVSCCWLWETEADVLGYTGRLDMRGVANYGTAGADIVRGWYLDELVFILNILVRAWRGDADVVAQLPVPANVPAPRHIDLLPASGKKLGTARNAAAADFAMGRPYRAKRFAVEKSIAAPWTAIVEVLPARFQKSRDTAYVQIIDGLRSTLVDGIENKSVRHSVAMPDLLSILPPQIAADRHTKSVGYLGLNVQRDRFVNVEGYASVAAQGALFNTAADKLSALGTVFPQFSGTLSLTTANRMQNESNGVSCASAEFSPAAARKFQSTRNAQSTWRSALNPAEVHTLDVCRITAARVLDTLAGVPCAMLEICRNGKAPADTILKNMAVTEMAAQYLAAATHGASAVAMGAVDSASAHMAKAMYRSSLKLEYSKSHIAAAEHIMALHRATGGSHQAGYMAALPYHAGAQDSAAAKTFPFGCMEQVHYSTAALWGSPGLALCDYTDQGRVNDCFRRTSHASAGTHDYGNVSSCKIHTALLSGAAVSTHKYSRMGGPKVHAAAEITVKAETKSYHAQAVHSASEAQSLTVGGLRFPETAVLSTQTMSGSSMTAEAVGFTELPGAFENTVSQASASVRAVLPVVQSAKKAVHAQHRAGLKLIVVEPEWLEPVRAGSDLYIRQVYNSYQDRDKVFIDTVVWYEPIQSGANLHIRSADSSWQDDEKVYIDLPVFYEPKQAGEDLYIRSAASVWTDGDSANIDTAVFLKPVQEGSNLYIRQNIFGGE